MERDQLSGFESIARGGRGALPTDVWVAPLGEGARRDCARGGGVFDQLPAATYYLLNWWRNVSGINGEMLTGWACAQPGNVAQCPPMCGSGHWRRVSGFCSATLQILRPAGCPFLIAQPGNVAHCSPRGSVHELVVAKKHLLMWSQTFETSGGEISTAKC